MLRLACRVIGIDDQAGNLVSVIRDPRDVAPGICRVGRVDAGRIAVNAAGRLLRRAVFLRPSRVVENERVGSERNCFGHVLRTDAFGQRRSGSIGSLLASAGENQFGKLVHPFVIGRTVAERFFHEAIFIDESRQHFAHRGRWPSAARHVLFGIEAKADRLSQQRMGVLLAGQIEHGPGPPGEHDAMHIHFILNRELQLIEGVAWRAF